MEKNYLPEHSIEKFQTIQPILQINTATGLVMDFINFFSSIVGWINIMEDKDNELTQKEFQEKIKPSWKEIKEINYMKYIKENHMPRIKNMHHQYKDAPTTTEIEEFIESSPNINTLEQAIKEMKTIKSNSPNFKKDYMKHFRRIYLIIFAHPPRI